MSETHAAVGEEHRKLAAKVFDLIPVHYLGPTVMEQISQLFSDALQAERERARLETREAAAEILDRFSEPLKLAEKCSSIENPMFFAGACREIAKAIRALAAQGAS